MFTLPESYNGDTWAGSQFRDKEVIEPKAIYDNGAVIDVDGYLHSIDGYPVYFDEIFRPMSDLKNRDRMLRAIGKKYTECHGGVGAGTVAGFLPLVDGQTFNLMYASLSYSCLPEAEKKNIRRFCEKYGEWYASERGRPKCF